MQWCNGMRAELELLYAMNEGMFSWIYSFNFYVVSTIFLSNGYIDAYSEGQKFGQTIFFMKNGDTKNN